MDKRRWKLISNLMALSESDEWDKAYFEWAWDYSWYSEEPQECLCGHYPINDINVIRNRKTGEVTEIGSTCVRLFYRAFHWDKNENRAQDVHACMKYVAQDPGGRSLSVNCVHQASNKGILRGGFEQDFMYGMPRKRRLSDKQRTIRERLNRKVLFAFGYIKEQN